MYIIVTYDIKDDTTRRKLRKTLRKYVTHQQFSVFEGEITEGKLSKLKTELKDHLSKDEDGGLMIYTFWNENSFERTTIGNAEKEEDTII